VGSDQRSDEPLDQMSDRLKHIESVSDNWFQFTDHLLNQFLDSKFESLSECLQQNQRLLEALEATQSRRLDQVVTSFDDKITAETDLIHHSLDLKTRVETLSSQLSDKKSHKTDLTNKTKSLTKKLDEMERRVRELKQQNKGNQTDEHLLLASVMRVMYKTWNNSQVVGLLFNDDEEKSLQTLIVMDSENKCPQTMSQQFWHSLYSDYQINH